MPDTNRQSDAFNLAKILNCQFEYELLGNQPTDSLRTLFALMNLLLSYGDYESTFDRSSVDGIEQYFRGSLLLYLRYYELTPADMQKIRPILESLSSQKYLSQIVTYSRASVEAASDVYVNHLLEDDRPISVAEQLLHLNFPDNKYRQKSAKYFYAPYKDADVANALKQLSYLLTIVRQEPEKLLQFGIVSNSTSFDNLLSISIQFVIWTEIRSCLSQKARRQLMLAILVCEEFRMKQKRWPKSLEEAGLNFQNPFTKQPMRISLWEKGIILTDVKENEPGKMEAKLKDSLPKQNKPNGLYTSSPDFEVAGALWDVDARRR
jgi:hypothetical protein